VFSALQEIAKRIKHPDVKLDVPATPDGDSLRNDADLRSLRVNSLLAEYEVLNTENQSRADFQHRVLQFHIVALTLLATAFLTRPLNSSGATRWLLLGIPFEASVFGLYWLDQAVHRWRIRRHIRWNIEPKVRALLGDYPALSWETGRRGQEFAPPPPISTFTKRIGWTFETPTVLVLLLGFGYSIVHAPWISHTAGIHNLSCLTRDIFPITHDYEGWRFYLVLFLSTAGLSVWIRYRMSASFYHALGSPSRRQPPEASDSTSAQQT
jgi:hypothetical protein